MAVRPVTVPYQQWTLSTAQAVIPLRPWLRQNRAFVVGLDDNGPDHWQNGDGWVGPVPSMSEEGASDAVREIARGFVAENVLRELVDRRADGVIGREPTWQLLPREPVNEDGEASPADQQLIDEAMALLTPWWDERGMHELLQAHTSTMLWARRSTLRGYVPAGFLRPATANGVPVMAMQVRDAADALRQFYVERAEPESALVYENPTTRERAGVYLYTENDQRRAELVWVDSATQRTVVRQLGSAATTDTLLSLGGRLTMYEAEHPEFISEQQRQMQRALNLSLSMLPRNIVTGGFLEMVVLNGMMPGHWETNDMGERTRFVPSPMYRGPSVTNWIQGIELGESANGGKDRVATPSVQFRPPTPVTHAVEANAELYMRMLNAAQQVHVLLNASAAPSGVSRTEARAEFGRSLRPTRARTQRSGRWLVELALAWVEFATGQPGRYTSRLRCDFQCQLDTGPLSVEERAQNVAEVEAGLLSDDTAMERNGVEDTDTEAQRIVNSPRGRVSLAVQQFAAVQAAVDTGVPFLEAALYVGIDPAEARKMDRARQRTADENGNPADPNGPQPGTNPPAPNEPPAPAGA